MTQTSTGNTRENAEACNFRDFRKNWALGIVEMKVEQEIQPPQKKSIIC